MSRLDWSSQQISFKVVNRKIVKYDIVYSKAPEAVVQKVNERLKEGWEILGPPFVGSSTAGSLVYSQGIAKHEEDGSQIDELHYVLGQRIEELSEKVSERIREGWKPTGTLIVASPNGPFLQPMFISKGSQS